MPVRQIADNSGLDAGVVVERMRTGKGNHGLDASNGSYVDLVDAGIIDPTKVVRIALENAVSVASVLLLIAAARALRRAVLLAMQSAWAQAPALMDLVLYVADPESVPRVGASPPSAICESLLVAKALPFRRVALSYARGEHKTPEMLARNPRGSIPVLTDGASAVHETFAIMLYVESRAPGHLPVDAPGRARALTRLFETDYLKAAGMKALQSLMKTGVLGDLGELTAELDRWDGVLAADAFAAGGAPTLADFVIFGYVDTLARLGLSLAPWPHLAAWAAKRPCDGAPSIGA